MDLPTFGDFLRTEAQLRLKILGPDWKESVLDESRWRYDLYKTWLTMLNEGVGEDMLDDYMEQRRPRQPESSRKRRRPPPPPQQSRSRRQDDDNETEYDERPPARRQRRRRKETDDNEENYDRPARRRVQQSREDEGERRRPDMRRSPPPPPPRTSWKNFSDLEESLQRSRGGIPIKQFPEYEDDEDDFDYEEEYE